jgi:hypothetical protein
MQQGGMHEFLPFCVLRAVCSLHNWVSRSEVLMYVVCRPECKVKDRARGISSKTESILLLSSVVCFGGWSIKPKVCPTCSKSRYDEWSRTFHHGNSETHHIINAAASSSRTVFNACVRTEKTTMVMVPVYHRVRVGVRHQTQQQHAPGRVRRSTILLCIRGCQRCIKSGGSPVVRLLARAHTKSSRSDDHALL